MLASTPGAPFLQTALEVAPVAVAVLEEPGIVVWANRMFRAMTSCEPPGPIEAALGTGAPDSPASRSLRDILDRVLHAGEAADLSDLRVSSDPQTPSAPWHLEFRPIPGSREGPARAVLVVRDVTDQLRERDRAALFYQSFLSSSNAIEVTDRRGILVDVNPAFERIYGYRRSECLGLKPSLVRGKTTPPEVYERMWQDLLNPGRGHWSGELSNRDRIGRERPVFLTITAVRRDDGETTHYLGVAIDLAEQKTWERVAEHATKLASLGQLAAGVAHEINTPLANVVLIAESLRRRSTDPWVLSRTADISAQVEVAGGIVRGLLDFARRDEPQVRSVDLVEVTSEALDFLRGKQSREMEFEERYPGSPVTVWGDRNQLHQVLTNLLNNACEAMGGSGRVVVEVRRSDGDAVVEITDAGPGISAEALPHIFEPFFTTKPEGKGTGLGLAICHGILQAHHGSISARNVPGGGASVAFRIPLSAAPLPRVGS